MQWSSDNMYDGRLVADNSVSDHLLEIEDIDDEITEWGSCPLFLLDTSGCEMHESLDAENGSKYNKGEASMVVYFLWKLLSWVPPD